MSKDCIETYTRVDLAANLHRYRQESFQMKDSTKDKVEGAMHEAKGAIKEKTGRVINNPNLEAEGQDEKVAGKIQKKVGDIEKVVEK
jgi:uncharacterized protein YjbJ (UPF0337 family)